MMYISRFYCTLVLNSLVPQIQQVAFGKRVAGYKTFYLLSHHYNWFRSLGVNLCRWEVVTNCYYFGFPNSLKNIVSQLPVHCTNWSCGYNLRKTLPVKEFGESDQLFLVSDAQHVRQAV